MGSSTKRKSPEDGTSQSKKKKSGEGKTSKLIQVGSVTRPKYAPPIIGKTNLARLTAVHGQTELRSNRHCCSSCQLRYRYYAQQILDQVPGLYKIRNLVSEAKEKRWRRCTPRYASQFGLPSVNGLHSLRRQASECFGADAQPLHWYLRSDDQLGGDYRGEEDGASWKR